MESQHSNALLRFRSALGVILALGCDFSPTATARRPHNALRAAEAALVVALIRSREHADEGCRDLSLSLLTGPAQVYVSHVTFWEYQRQLGCNGPRGRQAPQGRRSRAPDTAWVTGPN